MSPKEPQANPDSTRDEVTEGTEDDATAIMPENTLPADPEQLGRLLRNPVYSGVTPQFWASLDAVCSAEAWQLHRNEPEGGSSYLAVGARLGYARGIREELGDLEVPCRQDRLARLSQGPAAARSRQ